MGKVRKGVGCRALTDRAKSAVRLNKETIAGLPDRDGLAPFAVVHGSGCASFTPNLAREWVAASTGRGMVLEMT